MIRYRFSSILLVSLALLVCTIVGVVSCSKVDTTYTAQFKGSWVVKDSCSGFAIQKFDIATGSTNYTLNISYRIGRNSYVSALGAVDDSCQRVITLQGITNSTADKDFFSIGTQAFTDKCGNNYTTNGSGKIKRAVLPNERDTLYMNLVTATTGSVTSCTFRGYIQ